MTLPIQTPHQHDSFTTPYPGLSSTEYSLTAILVLFPVWQMVTGQSGLCALSQDQGQCMSSHITTSVRQESAQLPLSLGSEKTKSSKDGSRSRVRVKQGTEPCSHEYPIFFLVQWPEQQTGHLLHVSLGQLGVTAASPCGAGIVASPGLRSIQSHKQWNSWLPAGVEGAMLTTHPHCLPIAYSESCVTTEPTHRTTAVRPPRISLNDWTQPVPIAGYWNPKESFLLCSSNFLEHCLKNNIRMAVKLRLGLVINMYGLLETVTWLSYLRDCVPTKNRMASVSAVWGVRARACKGRKVHTHSWLDFRQRLTRQLPPSRR